MPRLLVEHTAGVGALIDVKAFLHQLIEAMSSVSTIRPELIKGRLHAPYYGGAGSGLAGEYMTITCEWLQGRTQEQRSELISALERAIKPWRMHLPHHVLITLELREIDPSSHYTFLS